MNERITAHCVHIILHDLCNSGNLDQPATRLTAGCSRWPLWSFPFSARVVIFFSPCIKKLQMGQFLPPPFFSTFVLIGFRFTTQFRGIQLRATKTDAGIDVIHGLVKCLTQNEVPSPLPLYAFTHSGCSLARSRAETASSPLLSSVFPCRFWPPFNVIIIHFMSC